MKKRELKNLRDGMSPEDRIGAWLSAALEDPMVCDEMKQDIKDWFDQTNDRIVRATDFACPRCGHCCQSEHIKTWNQRCEEHPDHQQGMVSERMIQERMQEEIDELRRLHEECPSCEYHKNRAARWRAEAYKHAGHDKIELPWVGLTDDEIEHIADSEWEEAFVRMIEAKLREKNT